MAKRTIYATFRIDLEVEGEEVTDEMVEAFAGNSIYDIPSVTYNDTEDNRLKEIKVLDTVWEETRY